MEDRFLMRTSLYDGLSALVRPGGPPVPQRRQTDTDVLEQLERHGIVVVKDAWSPAVVQDLNLACDHLERTHHRLLCWPGKPLYAKGRSSHVTMYENATTAHVIHHAPGRRDVWPVSSRHSSATQPCIESLVRQAARHCAVEPRTMGLLPVDAGWAVPGQWHRDCEPLFTGGHDTPDFYFTVFVPLDSGGGGATECILGSHRLTTAQAATVPYSVVDSRPGDIVVMNGRLVHRGGANHSPQKRRLLYEVWAAPWFDEARN